MTCQNAAEIAATAYAALGYVGLRPRSGCSREKRGSVPGRTRRIYASCGISEELHKQLKELGLKKRMKILVHVSLSKIGYVDNGPDSLISVIKEIISDDGIIVMPAYNSYGEYKPNLSIVNEIFKNQCDTIRTNHVIASFAVWGNEKEKIGVNIEYTENCVLFIHSFIEQFVQVKLQ